MHLKILITLFQKMVFFIMLGLTLSDILAFDIEQICRGLHNIAKTFTIFGNLRTIT